MGAADMCPWALRSLPVSLGNSDWLLGWLGGSKWARALTPVTVGLLSRLSSLWGCPLQPFHPWPTVRWQQPGKDLNVFFGPRQ